jgi:hypothetical protein
MSLKDHSDTWVNATTFIHTSNAHLQSPRGNHSTWSVASQGNASRRGLCTMEGAPLSNPFIGLRMVAGRASPPQGSPAQLSAFNSFGLRMPGAQSTWEGELSHGRTFLTQESIPLARRGACRRESLDASLRGSWAMEDIGERTLLCPQQVSFLCDFLLQGVPILCHLALY